MAARLRALGATACSQLTWGEASGALGDIGTFLPLLIGLVQKVDLDLGTTLIVTGAYNIASGVQFGIPMCVQPMKTIAAVALAAAQPGLTLSQLLHAGLFVAACVLLLGGSRAIDLFNWLVPGPVVRGVQLAVGAQLAIKGVDMALRLHGGSGGVAVWRPLLGVDGLLLGGAALALLVATTIAPRVAAAGTEEAADEGGLGPRPTDTPFEPLLRRLLPPPPPLWSQPSAAVAAADCSVGGSASGGGEGARLLAGADGASGAAAAGPPYSSTDAHGAGRDPEAAAEAAAARLPYGGCGGGGGGCGSGGGAPRGVPSALLAVVVGLALAVAHRPGLLAELRLGPSTPRLLRPNWPDLRAGTLRAGLPQLPLTTLNSVIAVTQLAGTLFPDRPDAARWRPSAVALSVAALNLVGCWLGAMPCCHGAGGLAAQHKFGARTGAAPILLGCGKAALGLLFGGSLAALLAAFPQPLLGALLTVSGVELASSVRHTRTARGYTFALLTAVAIMGLGNTGSGFLLGLAAVTCVAAYDTAAAAYDRAAAAALLLRRQGGGGGQGEGGGAGRGGWRWRLLGGRPRVTAVGADGAAADNSGRGYGKL